MRASVCARVYMCKWTSLGTICLFEGSWNSPSMLSGQRAPGSSCLCLPSWGASQALTGHLLLVVAETAMSREGCFTLPDFCKFLSWHHPTLASFCRAAWFSEYSRDESEPRARPRLPSPTALPAAGLPADLALPQLSPGCSRAHDPASHSPVLPTSSLSDMPEASAGPRAFATGNTGTLSAA